MSFGNRLKELRITKRMTQQQLGDAIHVSKVSISGYENNNRTPDTETLQALADYFEVTTDYLLGRNENNINKENSKALSVAAHIDEDTTEEEMEEILDYIAYIKSKHKKK